MSGQLLGSLDTSQVGPLHAVQLDYYGKRAAAASQDCTVHVWDITDGQQKPVGLLKGHEGPVWKVAWAHPKFGSLLATCSYDMKIIIWKEVNSQWQIAYMDTSHCASVNDIEFCPWEHGLRLAAASSDGTVSVLTHSSADQQWRRAVFAQHAGGAQAVSWTPAQQRDGQYVPTMRLATGGCDGAVCVWKCEAEVWVQETPFVPPAHSDWVRAVAWRPDSNGVMASGGWDKTVVIWAQEGGEGQPWRQVKKFTVDGKVECLSWSETGSILAASYADGQSVLWKEAPDGSYEEVGNCSETGYVEVPSKFQSQMPVDAPPSFMAPPPAVAEVAPPPLSNELAAQQQNVLEAFSMT